MLALVTPSLPHTVMSHGHHAVLMMFGLETVDCFSQRKYHAKQT